MAFMIVRHRVHDYAAWRLEYEERHAAREDPSVEGWVMVSPDDPNVVCVVTKFPSLEAAKRFSFDKLGPGMKATGVAEPPVVEFWDDPPAT